MNRKRHELAPKRQPGVSWLPAAILALICVLYLTLFFWPPARAEDVSIAQRLRFGVLLTLVAPEQIVGDWFGNRNHIAVLDRAPVLGVAAVIWLAAWGWGGLALRRLGLEGEMSRLERFFLSVGVGLSLLSLFTLFIGLAGKLHATIAIWAFVLYGVALAAAQWLARRKPVEAESAAGEQTGNVRCPLWLKLAVATFSLVLLLGAMLPPLDFDVREYHLQAPKEWFSHGRITFLPHNIYANMPLGAEMQPLLAMALMPGELGWWYGALAGKTVMASFAILTALALLAAGQRWLQSGWAGGIAAAVYLAHPWIVHTGILGMNEPAVAAFGWLAVYCCLAAWDQINKAANWRWIALGGFFAGSAAACKYPAALFVLVPLGLAMLIWSVRGKAWQPVVAFTLAALVSLGPWLAKNWVLTGNPTYPLLVSVFGGKTRTPEKDTQWRTAHQVPADAAGNKYSADQFLAAAKNVGLNSEYQSPLLVPLMAAWVLGLALGAHRRLENVRDAGVPWQQSLVVLLLLFNLAAWWLATHRIDRFWVPALPLAAFLAAAGVAAYNDRAWRWVVNSFVAVGLVFCLVFAASPAVGDNRWFVSLDALRTDGDAGEKDFHRLNPAHAWLNTHAQSGEAVLLVGDAQPFDLEIPTYYNTCFDDCLIVEWLRDKAPKEQRQTLADHGVRYVLVDWGEIERYRSPGNYGYPAEFDRSFLKRLVDQKVLEPIETFHAKEVYRVRSVTRRAPAASGQ